MYVWLFHGPFHNRSSTRDSSGDFCLLLAAIPSFPSLMSGGFPYGHFQASSLESLLFPLRTPLSRFLSMQLLFL